MLAIPHFERPLQDLGLPFPVLIFRPRSSPHCSCSLIRRSPLIAAVATSIAFTTWLETLDIDALAMAKGFIVYWVAPAYGPAAAILGGCSAWLIDVLIQRSLAKRSQMSSQGPYR